MYNNEPPHRSRTFSHSISRLVTALTYGFLGIVLYKIYQMPPASPLFHQPKMVSSQVLRNKTISGTVHLNGLVRAKSLRLEKDSRIITDGKSLTLNVDSLISHGGVIETFAKDQTAPQGQEGRSAGSIKIRAINAEGVLHIHGRGENGGVGVSGGPGEAGANGKDGRNYELELRPEFANFLSLDHAITANEKNYLKCGSQTEDGQRGAPGQTGLEGNPGGRGGDSPYLSIVIGNPSNFRVEPLLTPGHGGRGGSGGLGGAGGLGGKAGERDPLELCRAAVSGSPGPNGLPGNPGEKGQDGTERPVCLDLGGIQSPGCVPQFQKTNY